MPEIRWDRRQLLKAMSVGAAAGALAGGAHDARGTAGQVVGRHRGP